MDQDKKQKWLDVAEVFDAFRIMPRMVLVTSLGFAAWYIITITLWYMHLPVIERTAEVSGFAGLTIPAVFGLAGTITNWYLKTGRNWSNSPDHVGE